MNELFREALRRYMRPDEDWEALLSRSRARGKTMGIQCEDDVERMSDEFRREQQHPGSQ